MLNDNPLPEIEDIGKFWLSGDRCLEIFSNGFEYTISTETGRPFHNEFGPAKYSEDSDGVHEEFWIHGNQHREDGPAVIDYEEEPFIFYRSMTKAERITEYMKHADCCYYQWFWQDQELEFLEWLKRTDLPKKDRALLLLKYR